LTELSDDAATPTPTLSYVIGRLDRVVRSAIAGAVREHGLSVTQYTVLSVLGHRGSLSNAQLARRSYVSPQSMNEVLLALEERGFVLRQDDPNHGRIRQTALTHKGRQALAACGDKVSLVEDSMTSELSTSERNELHRLMVKCVRGLHGGFPNA
jgi:DNA-binding MarR family transcriptional regulator